VSLATGVRSTTNGGFGSAIPGPGPCLPSVECFGSSSTFPACSVEGCDRRHVGRGCAASITTAGDDDRTGHRFQLGHFEPAQPLLQVLAERNRTGIGRLPPGDLRQPQKARALTGQGSTATAGAMTASTAAENAPLCGAATRRALDTALAPPFAGHPAFHRQSAGLSFRMS
jgi:hypothetical protein